MASCGVSFKSIGTKHAKWDYTDCKKEFHRSGVKMSKADVDCIITHGMTMRCKPCPETRRKSLRFNLVDVQESKLTLDDITENYVTVLRARGSNILVLINLTKYEKVGESTKKAKEHSASTRHKNMNVCI